MISLLQIKHDLNAALASIEAGFEFLSSGRPENRDQALKVHQNGIQRLKELVSKLDQSDEDRSVEK